MYVRFLFTASCIILFRDSIFGSDLTREMFYHIDRVCVEFIWLFISLGAHYPSWLPVEIKQKWKTFRCKVHLYLGSATSLRIITNLVTRVEIYDPSNVCHETVHLEVMNYKFSCLLLIKLHFGVKMSFCINPVTVTQFYCQDSDLLECYSVSTGVYT